ncbi:hypothetical protein ACUH88_00165 [Dermabacteraceae bacterium P13095]
MNKENCDGCKHSEHTKAALKKWAKRIAIAICVLVAASIVVVVSSRIAVNILRASPAPNVHTAIAYSNQLDIFGLGITVD